jgi:hemerythrin superfamily protein
VEAIQLIQKDHREVEKLFKEYDRAERAGDGPREGAIVRELVRELSVHATMEEQFVYPALREAGADTRVLDALEEHHAVKLTLVELENLAPSSPRYSAKVRLLAETVRRHVEQEERELLPLLEHTFDDGRRRELGGALERAKRAAPTRPHPAAPDMPPGNFIAGAFAAVYDRSRDALRGGTDVIRTISAQGASRSLDAAKDLAARARGRSRAAVKGAIEKSRAAGTEAVERGREVIDEARDRTREASGRIEARGSEVAKEVRKQGRSVARATRKGAQTAGREYRASTRGRAAARRKSR